MLASRTAKVVVFIPPAVEPGEPPISIKRIMMPCDELDIADKFTVLKPAVLVVTDWKRAACRRASIGRAAKSAKKKKIAGKIIRSKVVMRITLLCIR